MPYGNTREKSIKALKSKMQDVANFAKDRLTDQSRAEKTRAIYANQAANAQKEYRLAEGKGDKQRASVQKNIARRTTKEALRIKRKKS